MHANVHESENIYPWIHAVREGNIFVGSLNEDCKIIFTLV